MVFSESQLFSQSFLKIAWQTSVCCGVDVRPKWSKLILNHLYTSLWIAWYLQNQENEGRNWEQGMHVYSSDWKEWSQKNKVKGLICKNFAKKNVKLLLLLLLLLLYYYYFESKNSLSLIFVIQRQLLKLMKTLSVKSEWKKTAQKL